MSLCLFVNPLTRQDAPTFEANGAFLFWDIVHPTTDAHRALGEYMVEALRQ